MTINVRVKPDGKFVYQRLTKDPEDVVDLVVDFTQYFKTDSITTTAAVGTNITVDSVSETANIVTVFLSGGTTSPIGNGFTQQGARVKITVSSATRTLERTVMLDIREL